MRPEAPNAILLAWWRWYCRYALRKHFHRVMLYGDWLAGPPAAADDVAAHPRPGTLYLCNHLSFWDGIVLSHALRSRLGERSLRCMVDELQVRKHPFFRRVGAFSVDRSRPRDGMRAVAHAADLLRAGHGVLLFPQGAIRPADAPLSIERGFTYILDRVPECGVVVLSLRYEFWENQRPELMVWASPARRGASAGLDDTTAEMNRGLAELRLASLGRVEGELLLRGRRSIQHVPRPPGLG